MATPQKRNKDEKSADSGSQQEPMTDAELETFIKRHMVKTPMNDNNFVTYTVDELLRLIIRAKKIIVAQPMLLELQPPILICGDIHGQFTDLLRIFHHCGYPHENNYLFLGDYIDRGPNHLETISLLLAFKCRYPQNMFLLRGNHEWAQINHTYGFYEEISRRLPNPRDVNRIYCKFNDLFNWLPISAVVGGRILCMHGGISPHLQSLDDIRNLPRPMHVPKGLACDLLWADPDTTGTIQRYGFNVIRGMSVMFGLKAIKETTSKLGLDMICRAHQVVQDGYELFADRQLVTIFSAPKYCNDFDNAAAVMRVKPNLECSFVQLKPMLPYSNK